MTLAALKSELIELANPEKAEGFKRFFKCAPGEYGEGDLFVGISVPHLRKLARKYKNLNLREIEILLHSKEHEYRALALFILVLQYEFAAKKKLVEEQEKIVQLYLQNISWINNWDLVDCSARQILGHWLYGKDTTLIFELAHSKVIWERRVAIIACMYFVWQREYKVFLELALALLSDRHDLIQKALGWVLREMGKRDETVLCNFLNEHAKQIGRTCLRYAIERLSEEKRKFYLSFKPVQKAACE